MLHPMSEPWVDWRTMETVPKDGSFLVCSNRGVVCPCQSHDGHRVVQNMPGFIDWQYGDVATRWAPFPSAPQDY